MYPTYDMNPIAIRRMQEERLIAMETTRPLAVQPLLTAIASISVLVIAAIVLV